MFGIHQSHYLSLELLLGDRVASYCIDFEVQVAITLRFGTIFELRLMSLYSLPFLTKHRYIALATQKSRRALLYSGINLVLARFCMDLDDYFSCVEFVCWIKRVDDCIRKCNFR